ncbi:MAG TPA: DUF72 domain-containing protein [Chthoniobacterales bacterium]
MIRRDKLRVGISGSNYRGWRGVICKNAKWSSPVTFSTRSRLPSIRCSGRAFKHGGQKRLTISSSRSKAIASSRIGETAPRAHSAGQFFRLGILALREKLGPILWQFPPNFGWHAARFREFFDLLPRNTTEAVQLARQHDYKLKARAWLQTDTAGKWRYTEEFTTDFVYRRLHGATALRQRLQRSYALIVGREK